MYPYEDPYYKDPYYQELMRQQGLLGVGNPQQEMNPFAGLLVNPEAFQMAGDGISPGTKLQLEQLKKDVNGIPPPPQEDWRNRPVPGGAPSRFTPQSDIAEAQRKKEAAVKAYLQRNRVK